MGESCSETPKSDKAMGNGKEGELYRKGKRGLFFAPLESGFFVSWRLEKPRGQIKTHKLSHEIQNIEWDGGEILSRVGKEIVKSQSDTVDMMKHGLDRVLGIRGKLANRLGRLLYAF